MSRRISTNESAPLYLTGQTGETEASTSEAETRKVLHITAWDKEVDYKAYQANVKNTNLNILETDFTQFHGKVKIFKYRNWPAQFKLFGL